MTTTRERFTINDLQFDDIEWGTPIGQVRFIETLIGYMLVIDDEEIGIYNYDEITKVVNKMIRDSRGK